MTFKRVAFSKFPPIESAIQNPKSNLISALLGGEDDSGSLYRVHRKRGQVFALIPSDPKLQAALAPLLPAQSLVARLYRMAVRVSGRCGVSFPRETVRISLPPANALVSLCRKISQSSSAPLLLPGNPAGATPRLILIALDASGHPAGVVKAGHTPAARKLIQREASVLADIAKVRGTCPAPRCLGVVETEEVSAFAMEFVAGHTPAWPVPESRLEGFLSACIDSSRTMSIAESPLWKQLSASHHDAPVPLHSKSNIQNQVSKIAAPPLHFHPCLSHGDFAPWNVRESPTGEWTAIDWERGELEGIPGWDWLHFLIQPAILVKKWRFERVRDLALTTINSTAFQAYLVKAIPEYHPGTAMDLLRAYLLYNWHTLQPTERKDVHQALAAWAIDK